MSRDDRYYAAQALDAARAYHEPAWSVLDDVKAAAKDARDVSRRGERRVGGVWVDEADVPSGDDL